MHSTDADYQLLLKNLQDLKAEYLKFGAKVSYLELLNSLFSRYAKDVGKTFPHSTGLVECTRETANEKFILTTLSSLENYSDIVRDHSRICNEKTFA